MCVWIPIGVIMNQLNLSWVDEDCLTAWADDVHTARGGPISGKNDQKLKSPFHCENGLCCATPLHRSNWNLSKVRKKVG